MGFKMMLLVSTDKRFCHITTQYIEKGNQFNSLNIEINNCGNDFLSDPALNVGSRRTLMTAPRQCRGAVMS